MLPESCLPWWLLEMFRVSPSLVLLGAERRGLRPKAGGGGGGGGGAGGWGGDVMRPGRPPLAPHCESAPARRKAACSVFFPVHRKTFDPGFSDSFLPPHPSPGRRPSGHAHPSPPPHSQQQQHHRAMARRQTRAPFFKVVRLRLINSQARPDWPRPQGARPRLAPRTQSELCAVCPREANRRGPRRFGIPRDRRPASQHWDCPATGSQLWMAGQRKADSWGRPCEQIPAISGPADLKDG